MDHEITPDLLEIAEGIFTAATERHRGVDDNRDTIHADFDKEITAKVGEGQIQVAGKTVTALLRDYAWMKVKTRAGQRTQSMLKRLYRRQMPIDGVDEALDYVVVVGEKRRSTLRHLDARDMQRMIDERMANLEKQSLAYEEFESIAKWVNGLLAKYGTLPAAIAAGAVPLAPPSSGTATA